MTLLMQDVQPVSCIACERANPCQRTGQRGGGALSSCALCVSDGVAGVGRGSRRQPGGFVLGRGVGLRSMALRAGSQIRLHK
eukprot:8674994-Karenia_brevis.AAC.1